MRLMIELKIGVDAEVPPSCATISVSAGVDVWGANLATLLTREHELASNVHGDVVAVRRYIRHAAADAVVDAVCTRRKRAHIRQGRVRGIGDEAAVVWIRGVVVGQEGRDGAGLVVRDGVDVGEAAAGGVVD